MSRCGKDLHRYSLKRILKSKHYVSIQVTNFHKVTNILDYRKNNLRIKQLYQFLSILLCVGAKSVANFFDEKLWHFMNDQSNMFSYLGVL